MSTAKAKTINLLLYEGNLEGVISIEDSSWNSGELYSAPRSSVTDLIDTEACNKFGVYLLLSEDMVYVGQSSDLARRINQHMIGKDWWTSVVILTTKDDSLNRSDIDYLEHVLIDKATKNDRLDCDNRNKGNIPKVDKFRRIVLQQYLDEALFLMELIGISVFKDGKRREPNKEKVLIDTIDTKAKLRLGKRVKKEAVEYIESKGIKLGKNITYAVRQEGKQEFWANPPTSYLDDDWFIILNDTFETKLLVLKVPAKELSLKNEKAIGLYIRKDRDAIDLKISGNTLKDRYSEIEFSKYIIETINY